MIKLENLTMGFGRRKLIENACAEFGSGRLTALLGRNGSGKSTLLRAMAGLNRNYTGRIIIDGDPDIAASPHRARTVAFVNTSRVRTAGLRCRDVVALGRAPYTNWLGHMQPQDREITETALRRVSMIDFADRPIDTLSDGETQRVMIARALAQDTPVILLDEPTSFLDLPNRYEVVSLLHDLTRTAGKCIIFSTHELDIALRLADDIALIDTPRLITATAAETAESDILSRVFAIPDATIFVR